MKLECSIFITLDIPFSIAAVESILSVMLDQGAKFADKNSSLTSDKTYLTQFYIDAAKQYYEIPDKADFPALSVHCKRAYIRLGLLKDKDNNLEIDFFFHGDSWIVKNSKDTSWEREYPLENDFEGPDVDKCMKFALKVVEDFCIKKLDMFMDR